MATASDNGKEEKGNLGEPQAEHTHPLLYSLKIGFFAGLIWGLVRWLATGLNFTNVHQAFLLDPFVQRKVLAGFFWQAGGLLMFIAMSMIAAVVYAALFLRLRGPWPGFFFGGGWWALTYAWLGPLVGAVPPLKQIGWNSMVTDLCLYLIWGLFIGYSIAFEFHDESKREPSPKTGKGSAPTSS